MKFLQGIGKPPKKKLAYIDSIDSSIYPFFIKCWENNLIEVLDE